MSAVDGHTGLPGDGGPRPGDPAIGSPGDESAGETDRLLLGVEDDLNSVDVLDTADQVPIYDRMHTALADALARTADTGGPPGPGDPGA